MRIINRIFTYLAVPAMLAVLAGCATGPDYDSAPATPLNISPLEESDVVINTETTFVWQATENTSFYEFHIFNNANKDIEQHARRNLRPGTVCDNDQCSVTLSVALPFKRDHAWRVRAGNNAGMSTWSRTRFNMIGSGTGADSGNAGGVGSLSAPTIPTPVSPDKVEVQAQTLVDFVWRATTEATGYDFHIFDSVNSEMVDTLDDLPSTVVCQDGDLCRITRTVRLSPASSHAWRVRAVNQNGRSEWTRTEFNVSR